MRSVESWSNRRSYARVRPDPRAPVEIQIMGDGFLDVVRARDISAGGLSVYVPHDFAGCNIQAAVELVVKLPKTRPFMARGVVRHLSAEAASRHYFGVEFTDVPAEKRGQIEAYVQQRLSLGAVA
jgi:c-di-GMP-binding flagellar brake protein YcgR